VIRSRVVAGFVCAALLIGCASGDDTDADTTSVTTTATSGGAPTTDPANTASPTTDDDVEPKFAATLGEPTEGWTEPVDIASRFAPGSDPTNYLVERIGIVSLLNSDGSRGSLALDMSDSTVAEGERGLLGLAFSFDGARAFVNYTDLDGHTNVDQYSVRDDGTFDESSRSRVYFLEQPYPNHNGGEIVWADGSLWVFTGDGGSGGDPDRYALNPDSQLGKVIELTEVDGRWNTGEVVAIGLRNPWRVFLDQPTDEFWIADVGQNEIEEINVVERSAIVGASFGWSYLESTEIFNDDQAEAHAGRTAISPVLEYRHTDGRCSISGGAVYRGENVPVVGTWFVYADWCTGEVFATCFDDQRVTCGTTTLGTVPSAVGVLSDAAGELWVLSQAGPVVPIVAM
jgi:glucose/arabinose dehydrogenase